VWVGDKVTHDPDEWGKHSRGADLTGCD
jgi:hypothetical protein